MASYSSMASATHSVGTSYTLRNYLKDHGIKEKKQQAIVKRVSDLLPKWNRINREGRLTNSVVDELKDQIKYYRKSHLKKHTKKAYPMFTGRSGLEYIVLKITHKKWFAKSSTDAKTGGSKSVYPLLECNPDIKDPLDWTVRAWGVSDEKTTSTARENFINECRYLELFKEHPHVVRLHDTCEFIGKGGVRRFALVMDYCPRDMTIVNLYHDISTKEINDYLRQLISLLVLFEENGIYFRDFKLANVLRDHRRAIKLADFGIARPIQEALRRSGAGTLVYKAPEYVLIDKHIKQLDEQIVNETDASRKSELEQRKIDLQQQKLTKADVWSAGLAFLELVTGKSIDKLLDYQQFCSDLTNNNHDAVQRTIYNALEEHCFNRLCPLISKMLNVDPNQRLSPKECKTEFDRIIR